MKKIAMNLGLQALALLVLCAGPLAAGAPLKINFQGRLDESGQPAEGSKSFAFKLYDAASGGTLVWTSQTQAVAVSQGVFSAVLSTGTPADLSTATFSGARYVEIIVDGVPLSPRQEMVSAPYAMVAQALAPDAQLPASVIADGSVTDAKVSLSTAAVSSGRFGDDRVQITTGAVVSGKFGDDRVYISTGAFYGGFNAADKLVQLDGLGKLPAVDGSQLTNLPPPSGAVNRSGDTMTGQLTVAGATLTVTGNSFSVGVSTLVVDQGRVGIRTASPNYALDVQGGSVNASAGLCIADSCKSSWASIDDLGNHTATQALNMAGYSVHNVSTLTVTGGAFSVGGSTLTVGNGMVGVSTGAPNSTLSVGGPVSMPVLTTNAADYTVTDNDSTILADGSANAVNVKLPPAAGVTGRIYTIKSLDSTFAISIVPDGTETLDGWGSGTSYYVLDSKGDFVTCQSDGTQWVIIGVYSALGSGAQLWN